jgi:hypothetical protein
MRAHKLSAMAQAQKTRKWKELSTKNRPKSSLDVAWEQWEWGGGAKQSKKGAAGEKRREVPSWWWHLRCEGHPKIIIMVVSWQFWGVLKKAKTHTQQMMEPWVAHQCQKQTKKTLITEKWHSVYVAQYWSWHSHWKSGRTGMKWGWIGHHSPRTSVGVSHKKTLLVILQGVGDSQSNLHCNYTFMKTFN